MANILLVDDSRLSRSMEKNALTSAGHDVTEAVNGSQGLELLAGGPFDLIVTDLLMPICDGMEMLRRLRATGDNTPALICSADIQESSRQTCQSIGINGYLNKPVKPAELLDAVEGILCRGAQPVV